MKMNMKKLSVLLALVVIGSTSLFAQQITKFAVVDTARVFQAFYKDSTAVRNYERKKAEAQAEIDRVTKEIQALHNKKLSYDRAGNTEQSAAIQAQIIQKTNYLGEYTSTKNAELETLKRNLQNNDAFYKKLYSVLESVAESEGYSMVLNLQQDNSILWYSSSVDITDKVIKELGLRTR